MWHALPPLPPCPPVHTPGLYCCPQRPRWWGSPWWPGGGLGDAGVTLGWRSQSPCTFRKTVLLSFGTELTWHSYWPESAGVTFLRQVCYYHLAFHLSHLILSPQRAKYSVFWTVILSLKMTNMSSTDRMALSDERIHDTWRKTEILTPLLKKK